MIKYAMVVMRNGEPERITGVYAHHLDNNCLRIRFGTLNAGVANERIIPVNSFDDAWSEDS